MPSFNRTVSVYKDDNLSELLFTYSVIPRTTSISLAGMFEEKGVSIPSNYDKIYDKFQEMGTPESTYEITMNTIFNTSGDLQQTDTIWFTYKEPETITGFFLDGAEYKIGGSGGGEWGTITGTLSDQTDLQTALNGKQDSLTTQTAYTAKGSATKVPQITTNTLGQVTGITETSIAFPVTSVGGATGAVGLKTINSTSLTGTGNISVTQHSTITVTLTSAGWSSNSQTVSVTGVTASNTVIVSPAPSDIGDYADCGVYCSAQGSGTLTFGCDTAPDGDIVVNVLIMS